MTKVEFKDDFIEMYKKNSQHRYAIRILALAKVQEGYAVKHVAPMVNKHANTIHEWIKLYKNEGLDGLFSIKSGRGAKPKIKADISEVKSEIEQLNADRKGGRNTAKIYQAKLKEKYGVEYSLSGIYDMLHRMNLSWITSRSVHPKADPKEQEKFKKSFKKKGA